MSCFTTSLSRDTKLSFRRKVQNSLMLCLFLSSRKKKMFNILDYMPMMNLLMMATSSRKPKRHISYHAGGKNRHLRMPVFKMPSFRMPRFRMPRPPKINFANSYTKKPVKVYNRPAENAVKLEYSGWQPIETTNSYSPKVPSYQESHHEPEIITIENAHR